MNTENAAKMLIVAWVKDWSMRTLLDSIDGKSGKEITQERLDECHQKYPFLSNNLHIYVAKKGRGMLVRSYVSYLSKKLSNALWDTNDHLKKLSFFSYVQTLKAKNLGNLSRFSKSEMKELIDQRKDYRTAQAGYVQSRTAFKLQRNTNWFTVK